MDTFDLSKLNDISNLNESTLTWEYAALSDTGRVRKVNEDAYVCSPEQALWAVADGMGGHSRGDYASKTVVESLLYFSGSKSASKNIMELDACLKKAHDVCRNTFSSERVGSTVVAFYAFSDMCFFLWAGDSRLYRLRDGELEQLTKDHTVAQEKCARGELSPLMASMDPSANVLTRAVGVNQHLRVDVEATHSLPGDRYLLCSDGLYNDLERKEIEQYLHEITPQDAVESLISNALSRGGRDNTTVIVLDAKNAK